MLQLLKNTGMIATRVIRQFDPYLSLDQLPTFSLGKGYNKGFDVIHKSAITMDDVFSILATAAKSDRI